MKAYLFILVTLATCNTTFAQNTLRAILKDADSKETLAGATALVEGTQNGTTSDTNGWIVLHHIPDGKQTIVFSYLGYEQQKKTFSFPLADSSEIEIFLENEASDLEEVLILSTRGTRTFENIPTRIEFIGVEELEEKGNMKPGDIRMLLNESTGIQTQQTSPISANASIRIQGLDGRYTQILKDGFPLYANAASGLGLLQIPPLDLKRVEIIKGSTSTLYGGGAIAGLVNLISKTPSDKRELNFHINGTSALGLDLNGFYSQRFGKTGLTLFTSRNSNAAYDPADIHFSAIPKFERYNVNPRFFVYFSDYTTMELSANTAFENRLGGDMRYIRGKDSGGESLYFFEDNQTQRLSTQFSVEHKFRNHSKLALRSSFNYFNRVITIPDYTFDGRQNSVFSELHYLYTDPNTEWVAGTNFYTDRFTEEKHSDFALRDYSQTTGGFFVQNNTQITDWFGVESGLRGDYVMDYGFVLLPRLSALFKLNTKWSSRIGGGLGYKTPTIFTEESEWIHYQNVLPVNSEVNKLERSYGANADLNYKTSVGEASLSVNQLFFYTCIRRPLTLLPLSDGTYQFRNIDGQIDTRGTETNLKVHYNDFTLFVGYTFTDAKVKENGARSPNPLTSKHRLNNVLMYEIEDSWKIGLEAYYYSPQQLNDGTTSRDYWICGAMIEKIWQSFSVYANFENFTDTRQTRFGNIYTGAITRPVFKDIYAPLDGFVVNAGIKIKISPP
ncbi:MAG: TonB-dependent receptor [Dysgonamonadaceae bacterium]|jgi:iron complex outermembrane receptor protein|nr:TonB-dependent receptor [Dysgonamonadaceae bacterium]